MNPMLGHRAHDLHMVAFCATNTDCFTGSTCKVIREARAGNAASYLVHETQVGNATHGNGESYTEGIRANSDRGGRAGIDQLQLGNTSSCT
jgi:hypothetical protein